MSEPYETIQRVDLMVDALTLTELKQARRVLLDDWGSGTRADVAAARRKVEARIGQLEGWPAPSAPTSNPSSTAPAKPKKNDHPILGLVVLLVVVGFIVYGCTRGDSGSSDSSSHDSGGASFEDRQAFAWESCKDAVEDQLKAPATADFQSFFGAQFRQAGADTIVVGAYVDSENSFGAKVRSDWSCSADFAPGRSKVQSATVITLSSR